MRSVMERFRPVQNKALFLRPCPDTPGSPPGRGQGCCPEACRKSSTASFRWRWKRPRRRMPSAGSWNSVLLHRFTQPQGDTPQEGAVRVAFQPAGAGPAVADVEGAVLVQRQRAGVARQARRSSRSPCPRRSAPGRRRPRSRCSGCRGRRRRASRPSSERARPDAPATPPSTCSTVRAAGHTRRPSPCRCGPAARCGGRFPARFPQASCRPRQSRPCRPGRPPRPTGHPAVRRRSA